MDLRTPGEPSHTDILAFVKSYCGYAVIAVEGKVAEPFDELVSAWNDSPGKAYRLERLCASLGLSVDAVGDIRYQLLHRTVSAIHEAQRYRTERAIMLVHSFSARDALVRRLPGVCCGHGDTGTVRERGLRGAGVRRHSGSAGVGQGSAPRPG